MQYLKYYDNKQRLGTRIMWAKCPLAEFVLSFTNWCRRCQSFAKKRFTVRSRRSILCLFKKRFSIFTSNEKNWNRLRERGWERLKTIFKDECFFIKLTWSSSSSTNKKVWTFLKRRFFLFSWNPIIQLTCHKSWSQFWHRRRWPKQKIFCPFERRTKGGRGF